MSSSQPQLTCTQNFLRDPRLVRYLLNASTIGPSDLVYEIGPGKGAITTALARRCARLIAVEKDPCLAQRLKSRLTGVGNVEVLEADFLDVPLPDSRYKLFANVPFNITAAVVSKLDSTCRPPEDSYLVVQREAAERFLGKPVGTLYAALLHPHLEPSVLYRFFRSDFTPIPGVDVVMLRLAKRGPPLVPHALQQDYRDFVTYCFTSRHRTLRGTMVDLLGSHLANQILSPLGLGRDLSPSEIPVEQWLILWGGFHLLSGTRARRQVEGAERRLRQQQERLSKMHRTRSTRRRRFEGNRPADTAL